MTYTSNNKHLSQGTVSSFVHILRCTLINQKELVDGFGVYIRFVELEQAEQCGKNSATGLMKKLIFQYRRERLAACSATSGLNKTIMTAVFSK